jgi:hypothetical protein
MGLFNRLFGSKRKAIKDDYVSKLFESLSTKQKMSILNLYFMIGIGDGETENIGNKIIFLNAYIDSLGVKMNDSQAFLEKYGIDGIIENLNPLTPHQKNSLIVGSYEMLTCNGKPDEKQLVFTIKFFSKIGITEEKYTETINQILLMEKQGK